MKTKYIHSISNTLFCVLLLLIFQTSCTKDEAVLDTTCTTEIQHPILEHPKEFLYQSILDENQKKGLVSVSLMIKDKDGVWLGTSGYADMAEKRKAETCHSYFIASISKVFTSSMIYLMQEQGILSLDDTVSDWVDADILKGLPNAKDAQIKHLLSHTSGIPDYYTMDFQMHNMNNVYNEWTHEDLLNFAKKEEANNEIGAAYRYCNTGYVLLGMIMEKASGKKLSELYESYLFDPLGLRSAYYGGEDPIKDGTVKGYVDVYGDGKWLESEFLFKDELNTADGGIAITPADLGLFFEQLMKGQVINETSLSQMTNWFNVPDGWWDPNYYPLEAGYGIQKFNTPFGYAVGHTGSIMGFSTLIQYFPEQDATFVMLVNCSSYEAQAKKDIYDACLQLMFEK